MAEYNTFQSIIKEQGGLDIGGFADSITTSKRTLDSVAEINRGIFSKPELEEDTSGGFLDGMITWFAENGHSISKDIDSTTIKDDTLKEYQNLKIREDGFDVMSFKPQGEVLKKDAPTEQEIMADKYIRIDDSPAVEVQPTDGKDPKQQLLDKIAVGEGAVPELLIKQKEYGMSTDQYDMVYQYGKYAVPDKNVSEMTLSELYDFQKKLINATKGNVPGTTLGTSAVGKYQILKKSLFGNGTPEKPMKDSWADKLELTPDTVFTPELQEKIGILALKETGYDSFVVGKKTQEDFHNRIADIWASVSRVSGEDTYDQGTRTSYSDLQPIYKLIKPKTGIMSK